MTIKKHINSLVKVLALFLAILSLCSFSNKKSLPEIRITVNQDSLVYGDHIPATFSYTDVKSNIYIKQQSFQIKYRGNSSSHYPKKNYSLKFPNNISFGGLDSNKKWKLNAEYIDKTLMRNKLSYALFRQFSSNNIAPKIQYVLLLVNDTPQGIYALTERVDENLLRLNTKDSNAMIFKAPPISYQTEEHKKKHEEFISYSNWNPFYKGFSDRAKNKLINQVYYNQRYPKISSTNKKNAIHRMTDFIYHSSDSAFSNPTLFNNYFDLESLIDWHLLLLITNNEDGLIKNFYIYKQATSSSFKICPWDYDHSFGRDGGGGKYSDFVDVSRVKILDRLMKTNAFSYNEQLYSKFISLTKSNILTYSSINKMIKNNVSTLKPNISTNENIWPPDAIAKFEESNFKTEVTLMKVWIKNRLPMIENYLKELNID